MKFHTIATLATAASLLAFSVASAQGVPPKPKIACAADIQRFCPTAAPGKETMQCMRSHMNEASPGCQSAVQARKAMRAQQRAAAAQGAPPPSSSPQ